MDQRHKKVEHDDPEIWLPIFGYESSYAISNHGRVKSLTRKISLFGKRIKVLPEIVMRQYPHYKGHLMVYLSQPRERRKSFYVHRLVAIAFIPNPEGKPLVDHQDENKMHNHHSNLQWATDQENTSLHHTRMKARDALDEIPF